MSNIQDRLEYLRGEIQADRISYAEIAELQGLAEHIDPSDTELLEWAGVPEDAEGTEHVCGFRPGSHYCLACGCPEELVSEDESEAAMEAANTVPLPDLSFLSDEDREAVSDVFSDFGARCAQAGINYIMAGEDE